MKKSGFHRWAWLVIFLLGGVLMIYGGAQDLTIFFAPEVNLAPVPSWHPVLPLMGLICGLIVLTSAGLNLVWGWRLRRAEGDDELRLARWVTLISGAAVIADLVAGYYGFGSLMAMLAGVWLMREHQKMIRSIIALFVSIGMMAAGLFWVAGNAVLPPTAAPTLLPTQEPTLLPTSAFRDTLVRGPYLQSVTTDSVIIVWETEGSSRGEVIYGETDKYGSGVTDPVVGTSHAITLTNLTPYTTYHYRVEDDGVTFSKDAAFRTAAGPDQTKFTFAAFGDTRTQGQIHQEVVDSIVAQDPDFVLHTGDLVDRGSMYPYWETFFEIEGELMSRIPLFPALGNHEDNHQNYFDLFYLPGNERWYTFDYGNARFICLQVDGKVDYGPGSEQYVWLERELSANTQPWLFVYFHIPPYSSSKRETDIEQNIRQALTPLFEQYGVDVVFNGHNHNYERNEVNGVTYVVTGGGGAPLSVMEEPELTREAFAVTYHFMLLEIDGNHLVATVYSNQGKILDEFERTIP